MQHGHVCYIHQSLSAKSWNLRPKKLNATWPFVTFSNHRLAKTWKTNTQNPGYNISMSWIQQITECWVLSAETQDPKPSMENIHFLNLTNHQVPSTKCQKCENVECGNNVGRPLSAEYWVPRPKTQNPTWKTSITWCSGNEDNLRLQWLKKLSTCFDIFHYLWYCVRMNKCLKDMLIPHCSMASGLSFEPYTVGIGGDMVEIQGSQNGNSCG